MSAETTLRDRLHDFLEGRRSAAELAGLSAEDLSKIAQLGIASLRAGMIDQATRQFELLAALQPDLYLPHHYLGLIALRTGRFDAAVLLLDRAVDLIGTGTHSRSLEKLRQEIAYLALDTVGALGRKSDAARRARALLSLGDQLAPRIAKELAGVEVEA